MTSWIAQNWFTVLNALGVVGGLLFTGASLRSETHTRRVGNLLTLTRNHRELWTELWWNPNLARVLSPQADVAAKPVTRDEQLFVQMAIHHLHSAYQALRSGLIIKQEGLRRDIYWFFTLPVPRAVWERVKVLQNDDFVAFVEACRNWK